MPWILLRWPAAAEGRILGTAQTSGGPAIGRTSIGIAIATPPGPGAADALAAIS
jgi:hypothetical protein